MRNAKRSALAIGILLVMLFLAGCPQQTHIADVRRDPGRFYNKEIGISGNVTNSYGALGSGVYEVDDGTGKMWVLSESYGVPSRGAHVNVAGTVVDTLSFGGRSFATAMRETRRRR